MMVRASGEVKPPAAANIGANSTGEKKIGLRSLSSVMSMTIIFLVLLLTATMMMVSFMTTNWSFFPWYISHDVPILPSRRGLSGHNNNDHHRSHTTSGSHSTAPNIIFFLSDDQGFDSLSSDVIAPFLNKLQDKSIKLTNYYTQEICAPSRIALLTGRYPLTIGMAKIEMSASKTDGLPVDETTFAEILQENGYVTYLFGKWNLGNASPRYLPTARGFDYFLGYLDGYTNYWSKRDADCPTFFDILYADSKCYYTFDSDDKSHYSTHLYQDRAITAIHTHDFNEAPMFLFMSFQAVHNPFADQEGTFRTGIPDDYIASSQSSYIEKKYDGQTRQQYFKALAVMDKAVENIYSALDKADQLSNSYIIFSSDNGGCPEGGGRNGDLRGTKGSLFEGGVRVEAFVYSELVKSKLQGSSYAGLFHISDWFPTILDMAGVGSSASSSQLSLDGVSQFDALFSGSKSTSPRDTMLYNYMFEVELQSTENYWTGQAFAVRNEQYKLMHAYETDASEYYDDNSLVADDDQLNKDGGCSVTAANGVLSDGTFTYFLFDLKNDPYETTNLYGQSKYASVTKELYALIDKYTANAGNTVMGHTDKASYVTWKENDNYVVPWLSAEDMSSFVSSKRASSSYPKNCGSYTRGLLSGERDGSSMEKAREVEEQLGMLYGGRKRKGAGNRSHI